MTKQQKSNNSHGFGISVGIAALAAAAAGAYYLYGSDKAAKNRKQVKSWMLRMKAEVMDEVESVKELTQDAYGAAVDKVSEKYAQLKNVDKEELSALASRMKSHWNDIREDISETVKDEMKKASKKKK